MLANLYLPKKKKNQENYGFRTDCDSVNSSTEQL